MSLSAILKAHGHEVFLCVGSTQHIVNQLNRIVPDMVGISSYTGGHLGDLALARLIKSCVPTTIVFGGPHPTFFPEIIENDSVDVVCRGEAESSLPVLLDTLGTPQACHIPGIWIKQNGTIYRNGMPSLIEDLDQLPDCDRSLVYMENPYLRNSPTKFFLTGRGCPYNCTYCYNEPLHKLYERNGRYVRQRSVESVLGEIKKVREEYPLQIVYFLDDTFGFQPGWLEEFSRRYPLEIGLPFICQVRPNFLNTENTRLLARAGCRMVSLGIETGSSDQRQKLLRRFIPNDEIIDACNHLRTNSIKVFTLNMLGLPGDQMRNALETLDFNLLCRPDFAWASIYQPYPGTSLGQAACEKGLFNGNPDSIPSSLYAYSALAFDPIKLGRELLRLQRLFAIIVRFPWLRPLVPLLIQLPLDSAYTMIWRRFQDRAYNSIMVRNS